jgi:anti-anti-sigma factor
VHPLSVEITSHERTVTVVIYGELDVATAPLLRLLLKQLSESQPEHLVFELGGLRFADCGGARAIAEAGRLVSGDGRPVLRHARPAVRRVLELTGLDQLCRLDCG